MPQTATKTRSLQLRTMQGSGLRVDREAGVIYGVAVITAGETKVDGNGNPPSNIDNVTLQQVADAINASQTGIKCRFTHPELDGLDDITFRAGYIRNARIEKNAVRADMHFHSATDPNAVRLMDIAEKDPTSAGLSIVRSDAVIQSEPAASTGFVIRLKGLDAVDWVGAPAANPAGMLSTRRTRHQPLNLREQLAMNEQQKQYLIGLGMPADASEEAIAAFIAGLTPEQAAEFAALADTTEIAATEEEEEDTSTSAAMNEEEEDKAGVTASAKRKPAADRGGVAFTQAQADAMYRNAQKAERERVKEIRNVAQRARLDDAFVNKHIDNGTEIDEVRRLALNQMGRDPGSMSFSTVQVGQDLNRESLGVAVQDAIFLRAGQGTYRFPEIDQYTGGVALSADGRPKMRKPHARASEFRGHPLWEMGRRYLLALGLREAANMSKVQLVTLLMSRAALAGKLPGIYMAHNTGDFPYILADSMGKVLRAAYQLAPNTWSRWCARRVAADFKDIKSLQLGASPDLDLIEEGEDYIFGTVTESRETYALSKYGKGLSLTFEMMVNDDLDAFSRFAPQMGQACARLVESAAIAVLTANAQMADSVALFATAHGNLTTGTLSVASIGTGRAKMRRQTALGSSDPLDTLPRFLLVPEELHTTASQLCASAVDPALYNSTPNPFGVGGENPLTPLASARLSANSTTQWYLAADPAQLAGVEVAFLEGQEDPLIEEEDEFNTGNRRIKVTQFTKAKAIEHRALVRSSGS